MESTICDQARVLNRDERRNLEGTTCKLSYLKPESLGNLANIGSRRNRLGGVRKAGTRSSLLALSYLVLLLILCF